MAQPAVIDPSRPPEQQSRTDLTLARIGKEWAHAVKGKEFTAALIDFLRSLSTEATLRSYSFSILEFFDWYQRRFSRLVTPAAVRRADAVEYNKWLRTHQTGLQKWQLEHDPERRLALAVFEFVGAAPGADIGAIRSELLRFSQFTMYHEGSVILAIEHPDALEKTGGLARRLACLVKYRTLTRTPTVAQLRRGEPELNLEFSDGRPVLASQLGIAVEIPPDVFSYFVPRVATPEGPDRASTVATRLSALSSFWEYLGQSGENIGSSEPLIKHNIWTSALKDAARQAPSHQAASRARKTPSFALFMRLLATTFYHTHGRGDAALAAAEASFWGRPVSAPSRAHRLSDLRDRALLLFMAQTGARAREVGRLRRSDVAGTPPVVSVLGKRGKRRALRLPPPTERALVELFQRIKQISKSHTPRGYRAQELLKPDSPLLPAVAYWGANDWKGSDETGLTRPGIAMVLRRRAERAGIEPGSQEFARAHPHGLRHLFAKFAADTGTPMHRIQAMMGHASAATTGRYMEERDPEKLVVEALVTGETTRLTAPSLEAPPAPPERYDVPSIQPPPLAPRRAREEIPAVPLLAPPPAVLPLPAPIEEVVLEEEVGAPTVSPVPALAGVPPAVEEEVLEIASARGEPIDAERRRDAVARCGGIADEALRKLCLIYLLHWGEPGNLQALAKSGGRLTKAKEAARKEEAEWRTQEAAELAAEGIRFVQRNPEDEREEEEWDDEDDEEEIAETLEDLSATEGVLAAPLTRVPVTESGQYSEFLLGKPGSVKTKQVFSGRESGLAWWYGSGGALRPQMPIMSATQVGHCTATQRDEICRGLIELWREWADETIQSGTAGGATKGDALIAWIAEALDVSAQLGGVMRSRGAAWVPSDETWGNTHFNGPARAPLPRLVFREHLPKEVVNWFRAVGGQYTLTPGIGGYQKVRDEQPPRWYDLEDPILDLPPGEREDMRDWIESLTGALPSGLTRRFKLPAGSYTASRAEVAQFIAELCRFGDALDIMRGEKGDREGGPWKAATYLNSRERSSIPANVLFHFEPYEKLASEAAYRATAGSVADFDVRVAYKSRPERNRVNKFMALVHEMFGDDAYQDAALRNVARCGKVALSDFAPLFRFENGTISHSEDFKTGFASEYGTHSECVARRMARELWEAKKRTPKTAERGADLARMATAFRAYKVPCTELQEIELKSLSRRSPEPGGIFRQWHEARSFDLPGSGPTEAAEVFEGVREQYEGTVAQEHEWQKFRSNRALRDRLPTPVHLLLALGDY